jgi:dTDP-4-amino-4,6-dideoxygalactose transaminase
MVRTLHALGLGAGDEVATVANTDIACTAAIHRTGADVLFVDVEEDTHNIDPSDLAARVTPRTRAVLVVHMYGHPADLEAIQRVAAANDLLVVEDCAVAVGAEMSGQRVGTFGSAGCFSHAPSKILGTIGDGGTLVTPRADVADAARDSHLYWQMRDHWEESGGANLASGFHLTSEGSRARMVEWSAAVLRAKLPLIDGWIERRRRIAATYVERLSGLDLVLPVERPGVRHVYRNFVLRVPRNRDRVRQRLADLGVGTGMHYAPPLHLQPVYEGLGKKAGDLPVTERLAEELFGLPIYPQLTDQQIDWVVDAVRRALCA